MTVPLITASARTEEIDWNHPAAIAARNGAVFPGADKLWAEINRSSRSAGFLRGSAALVRTADGFVRGARLQTPQAPPGHQAEAPYWVSAHGTDGWLFLNIAFAQTPGRAA